jgi:hypothetical protein
MRKEALCLLGVGNLERAHEQAPGFERGKHDPR